MLSECNSASLLVTSQSQIWRALGEVTTYLISHPANEKSALSLRHTSIHCDTRSLSLKHH